MADQSYLDNLRHSAAHLLAAAVLELYPDAKPTIGPSIENGFYYDFDNLKISEEDLPRIEEKMHELVKSWASFERIEVSSNEAIEQFSNNKYKKELIEEYAKDGLTIFQSGNFRDLCRGGHIDNPKEELKHFKLLSIAGAYWRGSEKNPMLTRIYGTAFPTQKELDDYLLEVEKAKENDHRVLGKKLDLFAFSDLVGKGFVMYTPKGTIIINELKKALMEICKEFGAQEVDIPHLAKLDLYKLSGHAEKFKDELFVVKSHYKEEFVLKPVNCPHHTQIYASRPRSYRDLPISYIESTQQHRDEKPGVIGGLNRTRSFEIDDGHTFCTVEQIHSEATNLVKAVEKFYTMLNMWGKHWVSLSFRDKNTPEKYIGEESDWDEAENILTKINEEMSLNGKVMVGEAALYGPKIDVMLKDTLGNDRQLGTVQLDFAMPKRFGLTYTDRDGTEKTPVMIHRAILGSYGRFIANLLESTGGAFPTWLSPVQVKVLPITERNLSYAQKVYEKLRTELIRTEVDDRNETLNAKIRDAQNEKVPYMLIIGDKEEKENKVAERGRSGKDYGMQDVDEFIKNIKEEIDKRVIN
ncbi:threonine--tRNA ligase [Candidatus Woesebacteria bacterium RIFCSPHIGHO2_01_FULL_44_21]|uniref:Threonine--tRNA ligase n=1 Tax=Candidatus Woesebacteria bacterium RIFCSPHIGHO2_01_FULL_44_21 TaxID=1802503 RepID=A0A1F7Z181_9BACT|nr:MAG: threonine--tRNA ligase [Candidatus Woesebacteria bacterium RIFCSPHIGHO2_01_FULL_44_21]OGM71066.1 MAG: threonine--tRNA ligase [Candidatus Woesebacteria bacterium RIFCSPLOWO2_01_FULL_44_24b]